MPQRSPSGPAWPSDGYFRVRCPRCGKRLKVPPDYDGKKCRCTRCDESLLIVMPWVAGPSPSVNGKARPSGTPMPPLPAAIHNPTPSPAPPPPVPNAPTPPPVTPPFSPDPPSEPADIADFIEDTDEHEHHNPALYEPRMERDDRRPSAGLSMKWTYRFFLYFFYICFLPVIWLPVFRWLSFHLATTCAWMLTSTFQCPGCQLVYPAKMIWKCSCGFQPHYEKHILAFVCRLCGNHIGHTTCERCGTTIFVR